MQGRQRSTPLTLILPGHAAIDCIAIATGTDHAIAVLPLSTASAPLESKPDSPQPHACAAHATSVATAGVTTASVAATHGITSSPDRIGDARHTGYPCFTSAGSPPPPAPDPSKRMPSPSAPSTLPPSPLLPRKPHQEGWDLCLHCRKQYYHKMYFHCWCCNFKQLPRCLSSE